MKVLFRNRSDIVRFPGGDEIQLRRTREALEALGVETASLPGITEMPDGFDLVHLFNTTRIHETAVQYRQARQRGVPVVVSPIWHSNDEMRKFYAHLRRWPWFPLDIYQSAKEAWYARRSGLPIYWASVLRFRALQRMVCAGADALLPNSEAELRILTFELGVVPQAAFVIPLGFSLPLPLADLSSPRRDIICAGRIEPRKNQLGVIRAFKRLPRGPHRLLLYGAMNDTHGKYAEHVRAELVAGWVEYAGTVSQAEMFAAYGRAAVVVLASFFETCGLVVGEALACGANVCAPHSPYVREYYGEHAEYCDPYDETSITTAITAALARPLQKDGQKWTKSFSWTKAAELTAQAYEHVLLTSASAQPAEAAKIAYHQTTTT